MDLLAFLAAGSYQNHCHCEQMTSYSKRQYDPGHTRRHSPVAH